MGTNIVPTSEIQTMALAVAKSGLFGVKTPDQAMALMLIAQAENMHPAAAARDYHIIQGRPALKADAMMSRFQAAGGKVEWHDYTDEKVSGTFSHAQGGSVKIEWSIAMATKAGLTKNPTWRQYPRQMLRARCISEGIRTVYPGVLSGFYTPEEVADFEPQERDVTPPPAKPTPMPEDVKAKAAAMKAKSSVPKSNVIEGTATIVTHSPEPSFPSEAGDLSGIGNNKPDPATLDKIVAAFATIAMDIPALEAAYGKPIDEWTTDDIPEAREVFATLRKERQEMLARIAAERETVTEEVI